MPPHPEPGHRSQLPQTAAESPAAGTPSGSTPEPPAEASQASVDLPAQIGRYVIEGEIAHGGMGVVLRARDPDFNRTLAVKLLLDKHRGQADIEQRFLEEAQVTAQLQHPGIAPVHEIGRLADGRPRRDQPRMGRRNKARGESSNPG
jgi:hypothetical protein